MTPEGMGHWRRPIVSTIVIIEAVIPTKGAAIMVKDEPSKNSDHITLLLCGDVMTGRGIDQILPHPSDPILHEPSMSSAIGYVNLAEMANGPIAKPVDFSYIWGDALQVLERIGPDVRIINLETSVTTSGDYWRGKGINYRMHPNNISCLSAAKLDCCVLANNHVMDWGDGGVTETLETLDKAGIKRAGAGRNDQEAQAPAIMECAGRGRVLVYACGSTTGGIPRSWGAGPDRPGVNLLADLSGQTVRHLKEQIYQAKQPGDIAVASLHWGENWGYDIAHEQRLFAHRLIDEAGIDVIHGHSSHHVKGIEVYKDKPIIYGCGDFLNDYEGIGGYGEFRDDLAMMYFVSMEPASGGLVELRMIPMQIKHFRLNHASKEDMTWLSETLNREGAQFGSRAEWGADNSLDLRWSQPNDSLGDNIRDRRVSDGVG